MRILSKSKIIAYRQCPKRLWLEVHRPELREDSASTLARFQVGYQVGDVARRIYDPQGAGYLIDVKAEGFGPALTRSAKLLAESRQAIFEAGFRTEGGLAFADVMLPEGRTGWRMVEVKSSTSLKNYHREDVAVQVFIARESGVKVNAVAVACIDSKWVYPGGEQYAGLLAETDLTAEVAALSADVAQWMSEAQAVVARSSEPDIEVGDHCHKPFECGFCRYCHNGKPQPQFPLDWLPHLTAARRAQLAEQGVSELRDAPDSLLNEKQRLVKDCTLNGRTFFDAAGAAADLAAYEPPVLFLDFETIQFAVPIWAGTRPYQQIPFQFSLHQIAANGRLTHCGFLDLSGSDPSAAFIDALIDACGGASPIFSYNAGFESGRIGELAERFPARAKALLKIQSRIVDLLPVARNRYYHPSQQGSWSIKAVLPAAVPGLSYDALSGVKDGDSAMNAYLETLRPETTPQRKKEIEVALQAYCRLDTLALVRLWQYFTGRGGSTSPEQA